MAIWLLWGAVLATPLLWKGTWRWRWPAILLTPIAVALGGFSSGVVGYLTGTARLQYMGMPGPDFWNVDPQSGATPTTGGCIVWGHEFLTQIPNNAAVKVLASVFGQMPFSYDGPYPSLDEALALVANGHNRVSDDDLRHGHIVVGQRDYAVPDSLQASVRRRVAEKKLLVRVVLVGDRLLVFRDPDSHGNLIRLFDLRTHRLIATYVLNYIEPTPGMHEPGSVEVPPVESSFVLTSLPKVAEPECFEEAFSNASCASLSSLASIGQLRRRTIVKFMVNADGSVGPFEVPHGDARAAPCVEAAVRACEWIPAKNAKGVAVSTWIMQPIRF
jgi:hypothetical protein